MLTLLIVDGDRKLLQKLTRELPNDALTLLTAQSSAQALELPTAQCPDVVLLDAHPACGTGTALLTRAIFHHSKRQDRPFLAVNCASITETLLESEFFGHERGAFTGADRQRIGRFEQAHGGTLFLDEIGDMSAALQAKLLRVLQDKLIQRIGGKEDIPVAARIIAATHRDLGTTTSKKQLRHHPSHRRTPDFI